MSCGIFRTKGITASSNMLVYCHQMAESDVAAMAKRIFCNRALKMKLWKVTPAEMNSCKLQKSGYTEKYQWLFMEAAAYLGQAWQAELSWSCSCQSVISLIVIGLVNDRIMYQEISASTLWLSASINGNISCLLNLYGGDEHTCQLW